MESKEDAIGRGLVAGLSVAGLSIVAAASGCVVEAAPATPSGALAVSGPPPAPMREPQAPPPPSLGARAVWVAGYWHWTGVQYAWIPGHWESAPAGASWRAPHYSMRDGTYFYEPGTWVGH